MACPGGGGGEGGVSYVVFANVTGGDGDGGACVEIGVAAYAGAYEGDQVAFGYV